MKAIKSYGKTIEEISKLKEMDEHRLIVPIQEGKWSIREIIGHLYYWDKFILEQHAPSMAQRANLTPFPDHDLHNYDAIQNISRFETVVSLIDEFVQTRNKLLETIKHIENDIRFSIGSGKRQFTIESYFSIFSKHDIHHLNQIRNSPF
ncbi:DinB family protein [Paenibacillus tarimensis]